MTTEGKPNSETEEANNSEGSETGPDAEQTKTPPDPATGEGSEEEGSNVTEREKFLRKKLRDTEKERDRFKKQEDDRARAEMSEADGLKADLEASRNELAELRKERIVEKHKLPKELADRLRGDTPEELEEDAQRLAEVLPSKPTGTPASDAGIGVGGKEQQLPSDPVALSRQWLGRS